ncbi:unnamed protein product [Clonostachys chloroleuca]|uniref:NAD(P)-binding protein n=1 Tax=Clonostachys chloroleuca TaxID=1926264 RepID=A0AA35M9W7_9HYPO|nr:unnamed protein product [Clonostachys chloroleuca]
MSSPRVWFITGASSGLGLNTALSVLRSGDRVIGTGRNIKKAAEETPEFEKLGGQWLQLDVTDKSAQATIEDAVKREEERLGQTGPIHWVVVNNAGYAIIGSAEEASEDKISEYYDANVFGAIRVWKALIPTLRRHKTGTLVTLSSYMSVLNKPEQMLYCSVKAALASLAESYASLLAPFGVRSLIIEPGGFRTKFVGNIMTTDGPAVEDYKKKMDDWKGIIQHVIQNPTAVNGDPERFGPVVVDAVQGNGLFEEIWANHDAEKALHVPTGSDSTEILGNKYKEWAVGVSKMADVAKLTDADKEK